MKTCDACHVHIKTEADFCPLCGEDLSTYAGPAYSLPGNEYPDLSKELKAYNYVKRILLFATLLGCGASVLINWLVTPGFWWCLIVLASAIYCWLVIPPYLRRGVNFASQVVTQVLFTCFLVVSLDFIIGYAGWSMDYVVPSLLLAGILAIGLMILFNRTNWAQYLLYQIITAIFGFVPLIFYLVGISHSLPLVLVDAIAGLASILATFVLGDRTIKNEFKRRFHF